MTENNEIPARKTALSARAIEKMKPNSFRADIGEYEGRVADNMWQNRPEKFYL